MMIYVTKKYNFPWSEAIVGNNHVLRSVGHIAVATTFPARGGSSAASDSTKLC